MDREHRDGEKQLPGTYDRNVGPDFCEKGKQPSKQLGGVAWEQPAPVGNPITAQP